MILNDLLKKLIQTESNASEVYEHIAAVNEGDIKATALTFSKEEKNHSQVIKSILDLEEGLEIEVPEEVELIIETNDKEGGDTDSELAGASRKQLFKFALQMEKNSVNLYEKISQCFETKTTGKQQFEKLAKEERSHMYFILKKLHELK